MSHPKSDDHRGRDLDDRAEVAEFVPYFCLAGIDLRNGLVM